jgi:hypothetical protein
VLHITSSLQTEDVLFICIYLAISTLPQDLADTTELCTHILADGQTRKQICTLSLQLRD